jgi:hypothetical protein
MVLRELREERPLLWPWMWVSEEEQERKST